MRIEKMKNGWRYIWMIGLVVLALWACETGEGEQETGGEVAAADSTKTDSTKTDSTLADSLRIEAVP